MLMRACGRQSISVAIVRIDPGPGFASPVIIQCLSGEHSIGVVHRFADVPTDHAAGKGPKDNCSRAAMALADLCSGDAAEYATKNLSLLTVCGRFTAAKEPANRQDTQECQLTCKRT